VTVLQAVRATAAIANGGKLIAPLLEKGSVSSKGVTTLPFKEKDLTVVREGMLLSATEGTAKGLANSYVTIGAKTGTAQVGVNNERVNSWVIGFFPYEHPRYAFAIMLERGPLHNPRGGVYIMRQLFDWMHMNTPEYFRSE
jgi:penicillin-binding protein 2